MLSVIQVQSTLLLCAVCYPLITFCFKDTLNQPKKRSMAFWKAVFLVAVVTVAKLGYDMQQALPVNYYRVMEIGRQDSMLEVRKTYKTLSKRYHPDKNPGLEAENMFQQVKVAYDVLMDEGQRDAYNRFGPEALEFDPRKDEMKLISDLATVYLFWIVIGYLSTLSAGSKACRTWLMILGIGMVAVDVAFLLTEFTLPEAVYSVFPSSLTEYEVRFYIQSLFPAIIMILRALAESLYVDIDQTSIAVLKDVFFHQKTMNELLQELEQMLELGSRASEGSSSSVQDLAQIENIRNRITALRDQMDEANKMYSDRIEDLRNSSTNPGSNYYWLVFVVLYGGIYFFQ